MKLLQTIKNNIPNTITCMNLLSGCMAVMFAFNSEKLFGSLHGYEMVYICIGAAALFDFCDGMMARLLHAYSALGKELDSLADLISFGLAPGMLMFNTMNAGSIDTNWWAYSALVIPVFAALRLAKFNIDDRQTTTFIGLPVPANALFWIGVCAWMHAHSYIADPILTVIIIAFSYLMVSKIKMFSLKFKNLRFSENVVRYFMILGAIMFVAFYQVSGFAWTILTYIALSLFGKNELR